MRNEGSSGRAANGRRLTLKARIKCTPRLQGLRFFHQRPYGLPLFTICQFEATPVEGFAESIQD
jgi:hypothetical protein